MNSNLRTVATVWLLLFHLLPGWVLLWLLQIIAIALMYPFTTRYQRGVVCGYIHRVTNYVFIVLLNPLWSLKILKPMPKIPKGQNFMVMMNHLSNADPWLCIYPILPHDCKWICKGSLFKVPFGGWGLANAGDLAIRFTKEKGGWGTEKGSVGKMMNECQELLLKAQPLAIYPEGVRNPNPDGPIGVFKDGFFDLAIKTNSWIVPLAISGSEQCWPLHDWKFDVGTAYISSGEPIKPEGHTVESLKQAVYDRLTELRESHPDRVARRKGQ